MIPSRLLLHCTIIAGEWRIERMLGEGGFSDRRLRFSACP